MRILYVSHRIPFPPKRGGKIRPFNMIRHLSRKHSVTVASLARSRSELEEGSGLVKYCDKVLVDTIGNVGAAAKMIVRLPGPTPSSMGYFYSSRLHRMIKQELQANQYDLIFVHCSSVAQYVADIQSIPKILDFGDMDSQKWLTYTRFKRFPLRWGYWLEGTKLQAEEQRLAKLFDGCTCTTRMELETLDSFGVAKQTAWFPNGVDAEFFKPTGNGIDNNLISFVGRMDYFPNQQCVVEFVRDVFPVIRRSMPQARFQVVGASPPAHIRNLAHVEGVEVTGSVADVRPYITASVVNVAPLRIARGTQNKILEAMAMGVPVVTTTLAAKGVDAVPGEHLMIADSASEIADTVVSLMRDGNRRAVLAERGRNRVLSNHNWEHSMGKLDAILERFLGHKAVRN